MDAGNASAIRLPNRHTHVRLRNGIKKIKNPFSRFGIASLSAIRKKKTLSDGMPSF